MNGLSRLVSAMLLLSLIGWPGQPGASADSGASRSSAIPQQPWTRAHHVDVWSLVPRVTTLVNAAAAGYLLAGCAFDFAGLDHSCSAFAARVDAAGDIAWAKGYASNEQNAYPDHINAAIAFADGFLVSTSSACFPFGGCSYASLLRLDGNGNVLWSKLYEYEGELTSIAVLPARRLLCRRAGRVASSAGRSGPAPGRRRQCALAAYPAGRGHRHGHGPGGRRCCPGG